MLTLKSAKNFDQKKTPKSHERIYYDERIKKEGFIVCYDCMLIMIQETTALIISLLELLLSNLKKANLSAPVIGSLSFSEGRIWTEERRAFSFLSRRY